MTEEDPFEDCCKIFLPGACSNSTWKSHLNGSEWEGMWVDQFSVPTNYKKVYGFAYSPMKMGLYLYFPKKWAYEALGLEEPKDHKDEAPRCPWCGGLIATGERKCAFCGGRL